MENLITVVSLQGQAWAVAQDGSRRELKVGDTLAADEMVITADGAQIDLQFANNQVLTLIGEQETPVDVVQFAEQAQLSQPLTAINESPQPPSAVADEDTIAKEGHRFVQLVRIHEIIESDGFTPLTVARIQEIIKPLGMVLPERDFEQDRWKEHISRPGHHNVDRTPPELIVEQLDALENADADEVTVDFGSKFKDAISGSDITYKAENLPKGLTINPNTGVVSGKIDSSASQGGNTGTKGDYNVTITVTDPSGNSAEHEFIWTITNPVPTAHDDQGATDEDTTLVVNAQGGVLSNDNDPDGDQLYVTGIVAGENKPASPGGLNTEIIGKYGTLKLQEDGSYTYTPDKNNPEVRALKDGESLEDTFSYSMTDREGGEDDAVLRITINGVTDGEPIITPVDGNDSLAGVAAEGHATVYESGLTTDGPADESKEAEGTITVVAKDGLVSVTVGTEELDLAALTDLPGATPVTITTDYGVLTLTGFTPEVVNGITVGGELNYSYELKKPFDNAEPGQVGDENALDKIDLKVKDAGNAESSGTLDINIIDDVPVATPDEKNINEGALLTVAATDGVLANDQSGADGWASTGAVVGVAKGDTDTTNATGVGIEIDGQYGTLKLNADGSYTYQAKPDITDTDVEDVFTYTVMDVDGDLSHTTLTINVADISLDNTETTDSVSESGLPGGSKEGDDEHITSGQVTVPIGQEVVAGNGSTNHGSFTIDEHGNYTYTLNENTEGDDTTDSFTYSTKDQYGNTVENTVTIDIVDDEPVAEDDTDTVAPGFYGEKTGNVMTGEGTKEGAGGAGTDAEGADGASLTKVQFGPVDSVTTVSIPETGKATIEGDYGTLEIEANGDYSYTRKPGTPGGVSDEFTYTLTDGDGDEDTAKLTINIQDSTPEITDLTPALEGGELTVDEKHLPNGSAPDTSELTQTGDFKITSGDGVKSLTVTDKDGNAITVIENGALTGTLEIDTPSGTLLITSYDSDTGVVEYSYTLTGNEEHAKPDNDTELFENIGLVLTDYDDDTATGTLSVKIIDDVPSIAVDEGQVGSLEVDETDFAPATDANFVDGVFTTNEGADGATTTYSLEVAADTDSGLIDTATGKPILLYQEGTDVVGRVENANGAEAFRIEIDADSGSVTLTQSRPLDHPLKGSTPEAHDDPVSISDGAIKLHATAVDGDGDTVKSDAVDVGGKFTFRDDGPTIDSNEVDGDGFVTGNAIVDEKYLSSGSDPKPANLVVTKVLPIDFGADGAVASDGTTGLIFDESNIQKLKDEGLKSGTVELGYEIINNGHTIVAKAGGNDIFTIELKVAANGTPSYAFTLQGPLDHILNADGDITDNIVLPFDITATDGDGDSVDLKFKVEVVDDTPPSDARELDVNEDDSVSFSNADVNQTTTEIKSGEGPQHGTVTIGNDGTITYQPHEDYRGSDSYTYTVVTADGSYTRQVDITVKPVADKPLFADENGDYPVVGDISADGSLKTGDYNYSIITPEDVAASLKLKLPKIKDDAGTGSTDYSELLGAITLTPTGAGYITGEAEKEDNTTLYTRKNGDENSDKIELTPKDGKITIVITGSSGNDVPLDGYHVKGSTVPDKDEGIGIYYLTKEEYEAITAHPAEDRHENFDVVVSVKSYEVNNSGVALDDADVGGANGAKSTQTITVDVHAETDEVALKVKEGDAQAGVSIVISDADKVADITFDEDTSFNLTSILAPDAFKDTDGSETRYLKLEGLPQGTVVQVDGTPHIIDGTGTATLEIAGDVAHNALPQITVTPPKDFSGDLSGIKVILGAQDSDSDSHTANPLPVTDEITINLHVKPVAGDLEIKGVTGDEDTAIAFLSGVKVTDKSDNEGKGEVITKVSFKLPAEWASADNGKTWTNTAGQVWALTAPTGTYAPAAGKYTVSFEAGEYVITFDANSTLTREEREEILGKFTLTPPAHSSKDVTLDIKVTSKDFSVISGGDPSAEVEVSGRLKVTVKPVAERADSSTDDGSTNSDDFDVKLNPSYVYTEKGEEDKSFSLGTDGSFKLSAGWSNEDGKWVDDGSGNWSEDITGGRSEDTFALLTPYMTKNNDARHDSDNPNKNLGGMLEGSAFTYVDGDGKTITLQFAGEPVKIPMQYLDSVQFKGPQDWSGVVKIKVQAGTIDYDEDDGEATDLEVSGESWLTNLIIGPKADQVTLKVDAIIKTPEDTQVPLNIIPTSSDPSEIFNITIKGIPKGAKITYDGTEYDTLADALPSGLTKETDGSFTLEIDNFDTSKQPTLTPPKDSNVTIELEVTAQSVDTLTYIDEDGQTVTVTDADPSKSHTLTTKVQVQGVPDEPILKLVQDYDAKGDKLDDGVERNYKKYVEDDDNQASSQLRVQLSDLITELKSGETGVPGVVDNSETVTLRISGLPEGFGLENAGPALGGSGESRVWVITEADLANAQIIVPQHYSGTVKFTAQPVVTENDNPSEIFFSPQNVEFQITPVPEATLSISSSLIEDTIGELELMPVGDDPDEYISAVRIAETDVNAAQITLYDADNNPLTASGGYYIVTNSGTMGEPVVKAKGPANFSGEIKLDIQYQVTDPVTSGSGTAATSGWQTQEHTLNFAPVTDEIDLSLGDISGATTADGVTTAEKDSTVIVGLKITQKEDPKAGNTPDTDGSEKFIHVVVSGVPAGVSVNNAIETAAGEWLMTVGGANGVPFDTAELTHNLEFVVSGYADTFQEGITITTYTQDTGAATIEEDSIEWTLKYVSDDGPDPVDLPELELTAIDTSQTEDVSFVLGSVVTGEVSGGSTTAPFDLTVTIRTTPDDETTYAGMTRTLVTEGGEQVAFWTATVSGVTQGSAQTALEDLLNGITVTPPQDANSNNIAGGTLDLDVNVSAHAHGVSRDAQATPKLPITPVTDKVIVNVSENVVGEGEIIGLNISLSSENGADGVLGAPGAGWTVVGDKVFIHIADGLAGDLYVDGVESTGSDTAPADAPAGLPGGTYYEVSVADLDKLEFRPDAGEPFQTGSLGVTVWVEHKENNDAGSKVSTGAGSLTIVESNSGYEATIIAEGPEAEVSGDKEKAIELSFDGPGLVDSNEEVSSAYISGLPSGFTVYVGTDAASSSMANNAGNQTWVIPVTGGELPTYIAILPPANWSGSLTDVNLTVLSGHSGLTPTPTELPIVFEVTPVASGITLAPTLSFGDAGDLIALNLNASMKDPVAATGADGDAHTERTELTLTGFPSGDKVQFFLGTEVGDGTLDGRVTHNGGGNYTIRDLTQAELDNLKFVHGTTSGPEQIDISARTYEVDAGGVQVGDYSDPTTGSMNINISPVVATSGDDVFLWEGEAINGFAGTDTVQLRFGDDLGSTDFAKLANIEVIDMSGEASGANQITGLTMQDVLDMTDENNNMLKILGDAEDKVTLDASWTAGDTADDFVTYTSGNATLKIHEDMVNANNVIID